MSHQPIVYGYVNHPGLLGQAVLLRSAHNVQGPDRRILNQMIHNPDPGQNISNNPWAASYNQNAQAAIVLQQIQNRHAPAKR